MTLLLTMTSEINAIRYYNIVAYFDFINTKIVEIAFHSYKIAPPPTLKPHNLYRLIRMKLVTQLGAIF